MWERRETPLAASFFPVWKKAPGRPADGGETVENRPVFHGGKVGVPFHRESTGVVGENPPPPTRRILPFAARFGKCAQSGSRRRFRTARRALQFHCRQHFVDLALRARHGGNLPFNVLDGRNHRGMVAREQFADVRERKFGDVADHVDTHVACLGDVIVALFAADVLNRHAVFFRHDLKNAVDRLPLRLIAVHQRRDGGFAHLQRDGGRGQHTDRADLLNRALNGTDAVFQLLREVGNGVVRDGDAELLRLFQNDGGAEFERRRLNVRNQTPLKARAQPVLERFDVARRPVGGQNDLLVRIVQGVEGVKKLLLRGFPPGDELNIVDQQHVRPAVLIAEVLHGAGLDGVDQFIGELIAFFIDDFHVRHGALDFVRDGVKQVGFAEPALPVDEERVIGGGGVARHGDAGGVGEFVRLPDDEVIEGVLGEDLFRFKIRADVRHLLVIPLRAQRIGRGGRCGACPYHGACPGGVRKVAFSFPLPLHGGGKGGEVGVLRRVSFFRYGSDVNLDRETEYVQKGIREDSRIFVLQDAFFEHAVAFKFRAALIQGAEFEVAEPQVKDRRGVLPAQHLHDRLPYTFQFLHKNLSFDGSDGEPSVR